MKFKKSILLIATMAFIAGCGSEIADRRVQAEEGVKTDTITNNNITRIVTNPISNLFGDSIDIVDVDKRINTAGYLDVNIKGHNRAKQIKQFQYRFEWVDVNDFPLDTPASTWRNLSAEPGQDFSFFGTASRKEAVDFKIYIRRNY